ncbi:hypothetical protein R3P38DRAFT_2924051 [Favolaschia claudopus]|uniref:GDP-fucose protein O-fucosyltransferase 2 n=1 Tax=Favolaschia claudopus TaxID=2862362 RepID=A0AAW0BYU5_9AGAR
MLAARRCLHTSGVAVGVLLALTVLFRGFADQSANNPAVSSGVTFDSAARLYHPEPGTLEATTVTVTVHKPASTSPTPLLVKEVATALLKENLRPEVKYIAGWPVFGWNNQVIQYMNLLYLALITERVPILAPFSPFTSGHVDTATVVNFSEVFDLPRLQKELKRPILEWWQVKDSESPMMDELGCWSLERSAWNATWQTPQPIHLKLDISYSVAPNWIKLVPEDYNDQQVTFWALAALGFADTKPVNVTTVESPATQKSIVPDDQLLCFDNLYFVCAHEAWEFSNRRYAPAWRFVGRHMHWSSKVQDLADQYIRKAFLIKPSVQIPPYITIHVRRGDFREQCGGVPVNECLAPLSAYAKRVEEAKAELRSTKGIRVDHVIMTSDEDDPEWWNEVHGLGWVSIDHSRTVEEYGPWYPPFIDSAIQSGGIGFVATHKSTVSIVADRRVSAWNSGVVKTVLWGHLGADDH